MKDYLTNPLALFETTNGTGKSTLVPSQQGLRNYLAVSRREQVNVL